MARSDKHSPANFDPAAYTYVGSFDNWPEAGAFVSPTYSDFDTDFGPVRALNYAHAEYTAAHRLYEAEGAQVHFQEHCCDHCGAHARYISLFRHRDGEIIAVGGQCANRFSFDSRLAFDINRLKKLAASAAERVAAFGAAAKFVEANCPEMTDWLLSPAADKVHAIFADLARKLIRFGSLSEKQINLARKLLQEHFERERNGGRTDRQLAWDAEKARAQDCPKGRQEITGAVLKTEVREGPFGTQFKMAVKEDRGFVVWTSIPSNLQLIEVDGLQRGLQKGERVSLVVTLEPSEKDPKFGFGSRPSKARLLDQVEAAIA